MVDSAVNATGSLPVLATTTAGGPPNPAATVSWGSVGCGWARRQLIVLRLLGLEEAFPFVLLYGRDSQGWRISDSDGDVVQRFGTDRLNDFYRASDPDFVGRGTSPSVIDTVTGRVVTNNYHLLSADLETAWKPFHKVGAPDLYPEALRPEIDLLNQQLFDDVNNGTYKVIFAQSEGAARAAKRVFEARLADYDFRLASRRYLFDQITDSDVRLFQTLSSFGAKLPPGIRQAVRAGPIRTDKRLPEPVGIRSRPLPERFR